MQSYLNKAFESVKSNPVLSTGLAATTATLIYAYKRAANKLSIHPEAEFKIEHTPTDDKNIEIIFVCVHGLGGSIYNTWKNQETGETLPKLVSTLFPNSKILNYGYPNSPIKSNKNPMSLAKRANNFITGLIPHIEQSKDVPIIFIAHSMGGLVVKQALFQVSNERAATADEYNIYQRTKCVAFYAVPHRGSRKANYLQSIPVFGSLLTTKAIGGLKENSQQLLHLNRNFASIVTKHPKYKNISILSLIEEQSQIAAQKIVETFSSTVGLGSHYEKQIELDYNHTDICKPKDANDRRFTDLQRFIVHNLQCKELNVMDDEKERFNTEPISIQTRFNKVKRNDYDSYKGQRDAIQSGEVLMLMGVFGGLVLTSLCVVWAVTKLSKKR